MIVFRETKSTSECKVLSAEKSTFRRKRLIRKKVTEGGFSAKSSSDKVETQPHLISNFHPICLPMLIFSFFAFFAFSGKKQN